jgi:hypothetical protein
MFGSNASNAYGNAGSVNAITNVLKDIKNKFMSMPEGITNLQENG